MTGWPRPRPRAFPPPATRCGVDGHRRMPGDARRRAWVRLPRTRLSGGGAGNAGAADRRRLPPRRRDPRCGVLQPRVPGAQQGFDPDHASKQRGRGAGCPVPPRKPVHRRPAGADLADGRVYPAGHAPARLVPHLGFMARLAGCRATRLSSRRGGGGAVPTPPERDAPCAPGPVSANGCPLTGRQRVPSACSQQLICVNSVASIAPRIAVIGEPEAGALPAIRYLHIHSAVGRQEVRHAHIR